MDASDIAQVPMSIFVNGTLQRTFTLNGTGGRYVEIEQLSVSGRIYEFQQLPEAVFCPERDADRQDMDWAG